MTVTFAEKGDVGAGLADVIVVGCGFSGAVAARLLAENYGKKVLLLEKRPHIGGNMYDRIEPNGVLVHRYGPHIFHTDKRDVYEFLSRFTEWLPYRHRVVGRIDGMTVPIPFNFTSLEALLPDKASKIENTLLHDFPSGSKVAVTELLRHQDEEIREFGKFVYEKVFVNYTAKMWGIHPDDIDKAVLGRVPVSLGYEDGYFSNAVQAMPAQGYTRIFERMLDIPSIEVELGCDAVSRISFDAGQNIVLFDGMPLNCPVIYTGALDNLLKYRFGELPYRSLDMVFEALNVDEFQPAAVVNYPNEEKFTRITEFKHFTGRKPAGATTILREYPHAYNSGDPDDTPYYPIQNSNNQDIYNKYRAELDRYRCFYPCGRLAEYKYYDMDAAVARSFQVVEKLCQDLGWPLADHDNSKSS